MRNSDAPVEALKDTDSMPFGKYKGTAIKNVPPDYLLSMDKSCGRYTAVQQYITDNMDVIKKEAKKLNNGK